MVITTSHQNLRIKGCGKVSVGTGVAELCSGCFMLVSGVWTQSRTVSRAESDHVCLLKVFVSPR